MTSTLSSVVQMKSSRIDDRHSDDESKEAVAAVNVESSNERKRRRDSPEYRYDEDRRRRRDDYHVGSRYWGGEDRERGRERREDGRRREERYRDQRWRDDRGKSSSNIGDQQTELVKEDKKEEPKKKKEDTIMTKTGGAYIPPAKLRMMQAAITDKSSVAFQRLAWEALKKSIHGLINKVNISNIELIVKSLIKENIIRGRGLLCRSIIQAQAASPTFTHVYAALVAIINSKFPNIGELLLTRLILQFRRGFRRNDKQICLTSTTFIGHLVNQQVAHEVLALEILTLLLENATDDSVEIAVGFLKECGQKLGSVSPRGLTAVFDRLRHVLHEAELDKRVKYMIEVMFQVRKDGFKDNPAVIGELDLVEEEDQFTHMMSVQEEDLNPQDSLNVFKHDPDYEANEEKYLAVKKEILGDESDESGESDEGSGSEDGDESEEGEEKEQEIVDETETNLTTLRRTIYLTIQSSLDHNECAHKMMKMQMKPGQEMELCCMILDCCAQQRTYEKFFGLLAQRFCQINKIYVPSFEQIFRETYDTVHRLDTNKLRNVAKMFAHLLFTDAISWEVLAHIKLTEEDTTSSSRIYLKILFQELSEYMGLGNLNLRLKDPTLQSAFEGIFPRDDPRHTRFAINFFTSIGLGGLTDELREHLRTHPKPPPVNIPPLESSLSAAAAKLLGEESDSDSSTSSDSSDSSSSSSSSSDSSSTDSSTSEEERKKEKRKPETKEKQTEKSHHNKDGELRESSRNRDGSNRITVDESRESSRNKDNERIRSHYNTSDRTGPRNRDESRGRHRDRDDGRRERYRNRDDRSRERYRNREGRR